MLHFMLHKFVDDEVMNDVNNNSTVQPVHLSSIVSAYMSLVVRKPVLGFFDQVRHKPGCAVTEDC